MFWLGFRQQQYLIHISCWTNHQTIAYKINMGTEGPFILVSDKMFYKVYVLNSST